MTINADPIPGRGQLEVSAVAGESAFGRRLERFSDLLSPIVVKEVRQMVRGREFNYSFSLSLVAGLIVAFVAGTSATSGTDDSGIRIFSALMACLSVVGLIVAPLGAFSALRNERMERTLDLVTVTALSPLRIVIGKLTAQAVKLLTLFAALAPFVAMSFLLGGIDFPTILYSLSSLFIWSLWACAAALFFSCLTKSRAGSALIFGGMIVVVLFMLGASGLGGLILRSLIPRPAFTGPGGPGLPFSAGSGNLLWSFATMAFVCIVTMINLVLLAENRLLLPTEDRSTSLRIGFLVQFLMIIAAAIYPRISNPSYPTYLFANTLGNLGGLHLAAVALFSVTEELEPSRRIRLQNRNATGWRQYLAIFRPGGTWGVAYVLVQMALFLAVGSWFLNRSSPEFTWLVAICGYICLFSGLPTWIGRMMEKRHFKPFHLRAGILLLLPVAALLPDFLVYLVTGDFGGKYSTRHVLDPFRTLSAWREPMTDPWHSLSFGLGIVGVAAYLMLIRMGQRDTSN